MGVLCPWIFMLRYSRSGTGFSYNVTAVCSLNVQNGFWCICVGQPDLLELYNVVAFLWVSFLTGTLYGIEYLDVRDEEVTGG
jgi:hypothetical protein